MINKLFFSVLFSVLCLNVLPADTLKIHITHRNIIGSNNENQGEVTISQKFFTSGDTLFREIRYDESTGELSGYTFFFYSNDLLSSEEVYNADDKLQYVLRHAYDKKGNRIHTSKIYFKNGKSLSSGRSLFKFTAGNKLLTTRIFNGKKLSVAKKYKYDKEGKLLIISSKYSSYADTTIKSVSEYYEYDASGKIAVVRFSGESANAGSFSYFDTYSYDENGRLKSVRRTDMNNSSISVKSFGYYATGTIREFLLTDGNGLKQLSLFYEYRTNVMNKGIQKSVL